MGLIQKAKGGIVVEGRGGHHLYPPPSLQKFYNFYKSVVTVAQIAPDSNQNQSPLPLLFRMERGKEVSISDQFHFLGERRGLIELH
jgi:hypothetical protein